MFFSPLSIAITSLGEERANLSAFRTFVRFALVLSISSSSWCLERAAVCDCGTPWTFLLPFSLSVWSIHYYMLVLKDFVHFREQKCMKDIFQPFVLSMSVGNLISHGLFVNPM